MEDKALATLQLRRWFGRVMLTLLIVVALDQLLAIGSVRLWLRLFGMPGYTQLVLLNDLSVYLPGLILLPLLLRGIPRPEPLPRAALGGQEGFLAVTFSLGAGYLAALASTGVIQLLEQIAGRESVNRVAELEANLPPPVAIIAFVVVAPIAEEFIYRRLLLDRLRIFGDGAVLLIDGAAFGLNHGNLNQTLLAFVLGAVLSAIVLMTGRIRYTIGIHMLINGISVLVMLCDSELIRGMLSLGVLFCMVFALVIFFIRWKRYTLDPGPLPFTGREKVRACFSTPWTWLFLLGTLGLSGYNLFH